jgi:serine protease Do
MSRRVRTLSLAALVALVVAGCTGGGRDEPGPRAENIVTQAPAVSREVPEDEPVAQVAAQVEPSVVQVNVRAIQRTPFGVQEGGGLGSGVIYRRDGYVITNNHVVEGADSVNVAFADGTTAAGQVIGTDPGTDLAVVEIEREGLPAAAFQEEVPTVGQLAVAIGSPSGFQSTVTAGVISGLGREIPDALTRGETALVDLIQTDAAISPGNSGGALVNRDGEVVGINVAYLPQTQSGAPVQGLGFAIPAATAVDVADEIIETGRASTSYLGVETIDLTPEAAEQFSLAVDSGAIVTNVEPGTPADRAGLRAEEDVITAFGDAEVADRGDLFGALRDYDPGDTVTLTVADARTGDERTVEVQLAERPRQ